MYVARRAALDTPLAALVRSPRPGAEHTPREILRQPWVWRATARLVFDYAVAIRDFLDFDGGIERAVFTGAGSSAYAGTALAPVFRATCGWDAVALATTDVLLDPSLAFGGDGRRSLLVSIARSGDSPESSGVVDRVLREYPRARHLILCCNENGRLALRFRGLPNAFTLVLPPPANDRGLMMTCSFTSLTVAGQCIASLDDQDGYQRTLDGLITAAERALDAAAEAYSAAEGVPQRVCALGGPTLFGAARECALKVMEATAGRVVSLAETFLGLRHGPLTFVNESALLLYLRSSDAQLRRYEDDLIREIAAKRLGARTVEITQPELADPWRTPAAIVYAQMLAMFLCMRLGLRPDSPSEGGVINRVVQGVKVYDA